MKNSLSDERASGHGDTDSWFYRRSFALQFFERVPSNDSDLDIFVENGPQARNLESYLCEQEGYDFVREQGEDDEVYLNLKKLVKLRTMEYTYTLTSCY